MSPRYRIVYGYGPGPSHSWAGVLRRIRDNRASLGSRYRPLRVERVA